MQSDRVRSPRRSKSIFPAYGSAPWRAHHLSGCVFPTEWTREGWQRRPSATAYSSNPATFSSPPIRWARARRGITRASASRRSQLSISSQASPCWPRLQERWSRRVNLSQRAEADGSLSDASRFEESGIYGLHVESADLDAYGLHGGVAGQRRSEAVGRRLDADRDQREDRCAGVCRVRRDRAHRALVVFRAHVFGRREKLEPERGARWMLLRAMEGQRCRART